MVLLNSKITLPTILLVCIGMVVMLSWIHVHKSPVVRDGVKLGAADFPSMGMKVQARPKSREFITETSVASNKGIHKDIEMVTSIPVVPAPTDIVIPQRKREPKLHTVTYASHGGRDDRFCRAVESAIRHDYDLVILGWKVPWRGLSQKLEAAHAYAASLPPDDLLLFTDAFDVLFTNKPAEIIKQYQLLQSNNNISILFSAECGCWPHIIENRGVACFKSYPLAPTPYRYLNSGTWIGRASMAKTMLEEVIREAGKDFANANDQKLVADMFIAGRFGISLDYYNAIFQSMHMTLDAPLPRCNPQQDIRLTKEGRWHNERTGGTPAVIHFNGGGKRHHLQMEAKMWYKQREFNTPERRKSLGDYALSVPTAAGGKLAFRELCGNYL